MIVIDNLVIGEVDSREGRDDDDFVVNVGWWGYWDHEIQKEIDMIEKLFVEGWWIA